MIDRVLLIVAAVCFGLNTVGVPAQVNWLGLGLLCWVLTNLI